MSGVIKYFLSNCRFTSGCNLLVERLYCKIYGIVSRETEFRCEAYGRIIPNEDYSNGR